MHLSRVATRCSASRPAAPISRRHGRPHPAAHRRQFGLLTWLTGGEACAEQRGGAGLPKPKDAQQLPVVRLPGFLSDDDISLILRTASGIRRDGAGAVRLQSSPASLAGFDQEGDDEGYETDRGEWSTTYLSTDLLFQKRLPELHAKVVGAAIAVDRENWGVCAAALAAADEACELRTRVIELHTVGPTGGLIVDGKELTVPHEFRRGDAVVFPSHKYHCVQPVKEGTRQVMILELWVGEERACNHRCELHFGECKLTWLEQLAAAQRHADGMGHPSSSRDDDDQRRSSQGWRVEGVDVRLVKSAAGLGLDIGVDCGILCVAVGSQAAAVDVRAGDVIVGVNGAGVDGSRDTLVAAIGAIGVDVLFTLEISRLGCNRWTKAQSRGTEEVKA